MTVGDFCLFLENNFPLELQEEYDNSGLQIGKYNNEIYGILISLDITEEVINEALEYGDNLILSHHPLIFSQIKKISDKNNLGKIIYKAIENNLAIYSAHTNVDNNFNGINLYISKLLNLKNPEILVPASNYLFKLITFVPESNANKVREAILNEGAGFIGNYDMCSFNTQGTGTFRPLENTNPYLGETYQLNFVNEVRIETIVPKHLLNKVVTTLLANHPYEEVAYDIYPLNNKYSKAGSGIIAELEDYMETIDFFELVKKTFNLKTIKHSKLNKKNIKRIAICGGSGAFLIKEAINKNVDLFLTGEIKYHQYFEAENKIILVEIGHYESENLIKDFFYDFLTKKLSKFAIHKSKIDTNPIKYF